MTTWPAITFQIAFASSPLASPIWTDLSDRLVAATFQRGRTAILEDSQTGTATFVLDNADDALHPANTSSPFYSGGYQLEISKRAQWRATWQGTTADLFTGFLDAWDPGYPQTTLQAYDAFGWIARDQNRTITIGSTQRSDQAIATALDITGWSSTLRDLRPGQTIIQPDTYTGQNVLQFIQRVTRTEIGNVFIDGAGRVVFQDRHQRLGTAASVATFTNDPTDASADAVYTSANEVYDGELLFNRIEVTRQGGTRQTAEDAANFGAHGRRVLPRTGLLLTTDSEALSQATYLLSRFTGTRPSATAWRFVAITLGGDALTAAAIAQLLTREIGDRITIKKHLFASGVTITGDYFIEGVQMQATRTARGLTWSGTWTLDRADSYVGWVLGDPARSRLGESTVLVY